jgi:hypothetical protein
METEKIASYRHLGGILSVIAETGTDRIARNRDFSKTLLTIAEILRVTAERMQKEKNSRRRQSPARRR